MTSLSHSAPPWKIHGNVEYKYGKVGRDLTSEAGKEEGEDEEAVEMSVTEDPAGTALPEFAEATNMDLFILVYLCLLWIHKGHSIDSAPFLVGLFLKLLASRLMSPGVM